MSVLLTLLVICSVYIAPALAAFPRLVLKPRDLVVAPFISILAILLIHSILNLLGLYTPLIVQALTAIIVVFAIFRVKKVCHLYSNTSSWSPYYRTIYLISGALSVYVGSKLFIHGFDDADEIYSWNMWAIQHFLGQEVDYFYTRAPYPQLFPKVLSFSYMVLGSYELQTPVKTALVVLPFSIFCALGLVAKGRSAGYLSAFLVLVVALLQVAKLDKVFSNGMPDALMACALVMSMYFLVRFWEEKERGALLAWCIACAVVALLAKQPGLIWALFSLPVIFVVRYFKGLEKVKAMLLGVVPALCAGIWILTEGAGFEDNKGVTGRSFADRDIWSQLKFSAGEYLVNEPGIFLILVVSACLVIWRGKGILLFVAYTVPGLLAWFLFASYDYRAGAAALLSLFFLIAYCNYGFSGRAAVKDPGVASEVASPRFRYLTLSFVFLISIAGTLTTLNKVEERYPGYQIGYSPINNMLVMFGEDGEKVFEDIYERGREVTLWSPTNYVYGLFYGYTGVFRPDFTKPYNAAVFLREIRELKPDYLTDSGELPGGRGNKVLRKMVTKKCPKLFDKVAGPNNKYRVSVYKLNKQVLESRYCSV